MFAKIREIKYIKNKDDDEVRFRQKPVRKQNYAKQKKMVKGLNSVGRNNVMFSWILHEMVKGLNA